jgi:hypothetical protein
MNLHTMSAPAPTTMAPIVSPLLAPSTKPLAGVGENLIPTDRSSLLAIDTPWAIEERARSRSFGTPVVHQRTTTNAASLR